MMTARWWTALFGTLAIINLGGAGVLLGLRVFAEVSSDDVALVGSIAGLLSVAVGVWAMRESVRARQWQETDVKALLARLADADRYVKFSAAECEPTSR